MDHRDVMLPLSLRTLATRTLLLLVIASAVSCSCLPPEDGIRVVSAEKRVCMLSSSPDPGYIFLLLDVLFFSPS
jgi:oligosaccharyltransferase complex subunit alpha (ribophorin I)